MEERMIRVPSPLSEMLLVMVLVANAIDSATRFVIVAYLKVGFAIARWVLWLHRRYVLYPFFAALAVCVCAPWVHYQQTALRVANQRGAELALHVAALKNESEANIFRTTFAFELALQSAHTREFRTELVRADAFKELTSNGGPVWLQAQLIEHALAKLEAANFPREAQIVYLAILAVECGFNPFALNPESSAGGANQFIRSTGKRYDLTVENQLVMDKNIDAGIQHFVRSWKKIERSGKLQGLSGVEWIETAFPLFYQLHHDGQSSNLAKGPSKKAREGIAVGKAYLEKAIPVMFSEEPPAVDPENFRLLVAMRTNEVVAQHYEELQHQLNSYVKDMLNKIAAGEWLASLASWSNKGCV